MNNLNQLIETFLQNYTFNNIDILLSHNEILRLDAKGLEEKLVTRRRGGYCFENNQYFFNLLKERGYTVERYLGRVVYGGDNNVPRTHQMSVVNLAEGKFLADVGFGPYTPGVAVPLDGRVVEAFNGNSYRLNKVSEVDYQLEVLRDGEYFSLYQFNIVSYVDADFKIANYYTNTHKDSKFTNSLILSQLVPSGVKFLTNLVFTTILGGVRKDIELKNEEEFIDLINNQFEVSYSDEELISLYKFVHII